MKPGDQVMWRYSSMVPPGSGLCIYCDPFVHTTSRMIGELRPYKLATIICVIIRPRIVDGHCENHIMILFDDGIGWTEEGYLNVV